MTSASSPGTSPTISPATLDALRFPLTGSRLIEASAGTGKTFTIAMLYVRLVLGHGGEQAFGRPLTPPEILVVTFTEAATRELRDRIRARLAQAAAFFQATLAPTPDADPLLQALRDAYPPHEWPACARKLQLAAEWMDEAAVSTIHSWCYRMLGEHAFDSGSLFNQTLETDPRELLLEVVRDYWRTFFFVLTPADVRELRERWPSPQAFYDSVVRLLDSADTLGQDTPPAEVFRVTREEKARRLSELKAPWAVWCDELQALLDEAIANRWVDGRKLQARYLHPWLNTLRLWASGDDTWPDLKTGWERLTPAGLHDCWKDASPVPQHPALAAIEQLRAQLEALPVPHNQVLKHACRWVSQRFQREQMQRAQMGFQDLLTRLDRALQGENGARLAQRIREQFPVAMIDEFQDTDPLQYRIFDALYRVAQTDAQQALILIGDPKQAIYAFRGADIHTYLRARRDTAPRHYTLATNFRSTGPMVAAINQVFMQAEQRPDSPGAFRFRHAEDNPLPFLPVRANGRAARWQHAQGEGAALTCWLLAADAPLSASDYRQRMATGCAREVVRLLQQGVQGQAGFVQPGLALQPVQPGDMAILVNNGREAAAVREQLSRRGVRSVYLSDRESVFQTAQATELQAWLAACADPENDRLLRAALATPMLGLSWQALASLSDDERVWERRVMQFFTYQRIWRQQGVLPMLRRLMWEFEVPRRLLRSGNARALTDVLHLSELLQHAAVRLDGEHALLRYLAQQCQDENPGADSLKLRLESDADRVKVVTVHKSKGLEYPLVFLPFACAYRPVSATDTPLVYHDDDGQRRIELDADHEAAARADEERLGEDLRKFYVALTRARYATWVGIAPLKGLERSAPGYLLGIGANVTSEALATSLSAWCGAHSVQCPLPQADEVHYQDTADLRVMSAEPPLPDLRRHRWRITSYSGLQLAGRHDDNNHDNNNCEVLAEVQTAQQETFIEPQTQAEPPVSAVAHGGLDLHAFPRGAAPGSFLHGLLEWAGREGFALLANDRERVADQVARRCNRQGWPSWIPVLTEWLMQQLRQPMALPAGEVALAQLQHYQVEMEFWFALHQVDTRELDERVRAALFAGASRPALVDEQLNGMLKGFIDLVFVHQGRYYVLDYKSNWLGTQAEDYQLTPFTPAQPAPMVQAMLNHRYDVQLVLYLFALHRLLKSRLPDYDYDRHVGGAVYLFLRGSQAPGGGVCHLRPEKAVIEALEQLFGKHLFGDAGEERA
ncbi:exodeoxyribonuclease V subunit beta [Dickeya lacustris]|uniref:RecBCD enzyme subunit RecB n=1 Tax=Dickeya lacustris TaxID=2259638 RepID=A0ABY8G7L3_9GAMM|nr:exodeoxyribonuclease V subunit beta [Dickeya lacustris]WFN55956.1 exodeoxyribonuclease V subunit beta [Dickeya lacustris]